MCFGGKGGGGNQGGGSSQEDGEVRKAHREAGISAADTRRYFREKENPAHMRNKNAPGGTTSVSHSRDEGGNLVAKQVDYGQGSFAPPPGQREGDQSLAVNQQKAIRRDFIRDNKYLPDQSSLSEMLVKQDLSRTGKYQARSNQFRGKTPGEIEAIRTVNRKKNPADQDGDGSWLTSTDNSGIVYGIGTTTNPDGSMSGSGGQPAIYDPNLPEGYRGIPQVDPNRAVDTNLTMFGKAMRKVGGPIVANMMGPLAPVAGAMLLANKYPDKVPSFLTGRGTYSPAYDEPIGPNRPSIVAPPNQSETSSTSTSGSALSRIQSPYPQKRPTVNIGALSSTPKGMTNYEDRNLSSFSPIPLDQRITGDVSDAYLFRNYNPPIDEMMPPSTTGSLDPTQGDRINFRRNNQQYIDMGARGEPMDITIPEAGSPSRYVNYALNESGSDDNDSYSENVNNGVPIRPVIAPYADYAQWMPSSEYIGASSYGGPFSSASQNFASVLPPSIYSTGGSSNSVPTRFVNDRTKQYFTAPNDSYYAEENSDWRQENPYSLA